MDPLCVKKYIKAPLARVYEAWTRPEMMRHWFFPGGEMTCDVACDFRVGGTYRITMRDNDNVFPHHGEYREIVKASKIVFTWNSHVVQDTLVSVDFTGDDRETQITLTHSLLPDKESIEKHRNGWIGCLGNMSNYASN